MPPIFETLLDDTLAKQCAPSVSALDEETVYLIEHLMSGRECLASESSEARRYQQTYRDIHKEHNVKLRCRPRFNSKFEVLAAGGS